MHHYQRQLLEARPGGIQRFWVQHSKKDLTPSTLNGDSRLGGKHLNLYRFTLYYKPVSGHWILTFGIYLHFGACILVIGIILGGRAKPEI
jgi:hypothetical protein